MEARTVIGWRRVLRLGLAPFDGGVRRHEGVQVTDEGLAWLRAGCAGQSAVPRPVPVGGVVLTAANVNPAASYGFGTWVSLTSPKTAPDNKPPYFWERTA